ncbi:MAG: GNAT family N-acetyltransferase [Desulfobulbaceae bacterium]|nr:MAG: GNAT family N-acetyltransferase [Desulfobulbaceae bacterium]
MAPEAPTCTIRPARTADIPEMVRLLELLFAIEADFTADADRQSQGLNLLLQQPLACVMVAEQEGRVVGMCSGQLTVSTAEGGFALLVEDLVVAADFRGRKIAPRLLEAVALWAAGHGAARMQLLADRDNAPALAFYRRLGWKETALVCLRQYRQAGE